MRHHDLAIIGTGSGNSIPAPGFEHLDIALIEHGRFGGTCLNVGCIPTKMYVYTADMANAVREAGRFGIDAVLEKPHWAAARDRIYGRIDPIADGGHDYRVNRSPNVTVYEGRCRFTGPKRIDTGTGETITADRIVIAAGSRPVVPQQVLDAGVPYDTSDEVLRRDDAPRRVVILGAGYIASEAAHVLAGFGAQVSVVARGPAMLRHHDETVATRFTALAAQRWDLHLGAIVSSLTGDADGVALTLADGAVVEGDLLLVATGRMPNSDRLDLATTGVPVHPDGRIVVDEYQRTPVDGIFALGDVSSEYQLKHVANHEARVVAHNLLHPGEMIRSNHDHVPSAVFTDPQIATVGLTEGQAREQGLDVAVKVQEYGDVAYGWAMEDTTGFCKVIAERGTGRLLGAHLMGPQAASLIQTLVQAVSFGLDARRMAHEQYWIHPALPEVIENALLGLDL